MLDTSGFTRAFPGLAAASLRNRLFANGEQGASYSFAKANQAALFQNSDFTNPVTAVEQNIGSFLDLSGNGNHCTQPTSTARYKWSARVNLFLNSASLATQSVTVAAGSYQLILGGTGSVTLSGAATGTYGAGTHTITCTAGSLTCTVSGAVNDADIRRAASAYLPYQAVNTANDYETAGFPHYLLTDGVDDFYTTIGNIDFTGTDKVTVIAALQINKAAAVGVVLKHPDFGYSSFQLLSPGFGAGADVQFSSAGLTEAQPAYAAWPAGDAVITGQADTSTPNVSLRIDGAQIAANGGHQGGGNFRNGALVLFGSDGYFYSGNVHGLIVRGAATTPDDLLFAERDLAALQIRAL